MNAAAPQTDVHAHGDLGWLYAVRWWSVLFVLLATIGVTVFGDVVLPIGPLAMLLVVWSASNVVSEHVVARWPERIPHLIAAILALDAFLLYGVLFLTGGPNNPFAFVYLVHVALAAVVLSPRAAGALAALGALLYAALFLLHVPIDALEPLQGGQGDLVGSQPAHPSVPGRDDTAGLHLRGMWVGYVICATAIVAFVGRVRRQLDERTEQLAQARATAARSQRLASLATLAAGAAHELATPLSTIALVAADLQDALKHGDGSASSEDARLIREQVDRCRTILGHLRTDAGDPGGEPVADTTIGGVLAEAFDGVKDPARIVDDTAAEVAAHPVRTLPRAVGQSFRGLVHNALDADPGGTVRVVAHVDGDGRIRLTVRDHGPGIPEDLQDRIGEPFFTTKPTGKGMGLGVFLARAVADRLGGRITHAAEPDGGTLATFHLPPDAPEPP